MIKAQISKVTTNWIGGAIGGAGVFYAAKKFGKVSNKWALAACAVIGVVAGANAQGAIAARKSVPTASTTTVKK